MVSHEACGTVCLQRTATLNWPGLLEEGDEGQQPHSNGDSSPRNLSLIQGKAMGPPPGVLLG
jgi:hypothetical protein